MYVYYNTNYIKEMSLLSNRNTDTIKIDATALIKRCGII